MTTPHDDAARRKYWTEQLDAAYAFNLNVLEYPVQECGEPMVSLREAAASAGATVQFSTLKHVKDCDRLFYLRQGLIPAFVAAAKELNDRGWVLKVEDGYRTRYMQKHLALREGVFDRICRKVSWEVGGARPPYELLRRRVAALIAMSPKAGTHVSGSAIDVSVLDRNGREVDRGGPYLEMSELTPMESPFVSDAARRNRREITAIMTRHGFVAYPWEFWHYNDGDAYAAVLHKTGRPGRYGPIDFDARTGKVEPIADPTAPLNSEREMEARLREVMG